MELIATELGRVTRYFVGEEVRPSAGLYVPDLIRLVNERYGFVTSPTTDSITNGAVFQNGRLISGNKKINIPTLGIYNDGISVSAFDTDIAEFIVEDVVTWAIDTLGIRQPVTKPITLIESHVIVRFYHSIDRVVKIIQKMKPLLETAYSQTYERDFQIGLSNIGMSADPSTVPPQLAPPGAPYRADFSIGRRLGRPWSENRYFCMAPLRTKKHIEILEVFEKITAE